MSGPLLTARGVADLLDVSAETVLRWTPRGELPAIKLPRTTQGSVFRAADNRGIRWPENGRRPQQVGFRTKTEARRWFAENVAPRLDHAAPSPDIGFEAFCDLFLDRHGATVSKRTRDTLRERLAPARKAFGGWTLRELEGAADDIARWRASTWPTSRRRRSAPCSTSSGSCSPAGG